MGEAAWADGLTSARGSGSVPREEKLLQLPVRRAIHQPSRAGRADIEEHRGDLQPAAFAPAHDSNVRDATQRVQRAPRRGNLLRCEIRVEIRRDRGTVDGSLL